MPDLPNGRYGVTIQNWDISYSGVLDTTGNSPLYDLSPGYTSGDSVAVTSFNDNSGSIGWMCTVNGTPITFSGGNYNPGPPITVTGGTASASGLPSTTWSVEALGNGSYNVSVNGSAAASGKLVVSGQPGSQSSAEYRFGGNGQPQDCSSLDLTSGQIGWVVTDPDTNIRYTFTNGVYIPLQGEPHLVCAGNVQFPSPDADDDSWIADNSSSEPMAHAQAAPKC